MATRHVIVGGGPAGQNAIETLRALDPSAAITLVCDEPAYARMVLPYYLGGKVGEPGVLTGDDDWWKALRVETRFGVRAAALDPGAHALRLADGETLAYDRLLIATGSRTARPKIAGLDAPSVMNMWTLADARTFLAAPRRSTVIVGAGFIAFTVLDGIAARSRQVSFVELEPQVLPHMLDVRAARLLEDHLRGRGIAVRTAARVERIAGGAVKLAGGEFIPADAVILATGVQPNVELLEGSGVEVDHGILVDGRMQTSAPDVFAAGDVAQGPVLLSGGRRVLAIQPTAVDHGRVAGANMAGADVVYEGSLVMNVLAAQGVEAASFGRWEEDGDTCVVENASNHVYRKLVFGGARGDVLVGGILLGPSVAVSGQNDAGMLKGLVQTGVALGPWRDYLKENPLDLRRVYVASGAAKQLLGTTLLAGRAATGGGFRLPKLAARRARSPHHAALVAEAP
jgi:NAD(P)H-nitrite reductase large subunit